MKLYIAVLDEVDDFMVPTLVAHSVLRYHMYATRSDFCYVYEDYLLNSFKKVVLKVNRKEFDKISQLDDVVLSHENTQLEGKPSCAVWLFEGELMPNVIKYAKMWKPNNSSVAKQV